MRNLILLLATVMLASCVAGGRSGSDVPATTAAPVLGAPTAVPTLDPTAVAAVPTSEPGAAFVGPLILFFLENTYEETYLGLFDAGSGGFRELPGSIGTYLDEVQWIDDGCGLFARGQALDLTGTPVWSIPPEVEAAVPDLSVARLSPDRRWLAHALPSDAGLDVEIIALEAPFERITVTRNRGGDSRAIVWAPDSAGLYFTDRDDNGIVQLYRAGVESGGVEMLTAHTDPGQIINDIAASSNGGRLAYAVRSAAVFQQPYAHDPADEGWVGLVNLADGTTRRVVLPKLGAVENERGLWWDAGGSTLLVIGDSLPVATDDPLAGRRAHWITAEGDVRRSFHQKDAPDGYAGWVMPFRDIDTLLLNGLDGNYTLTADGFRRVAPALLPPVGQTMDRRVIGILPAPLGFPGEAACP